MPSVIAYHVVFCTHGFWLPNDPRGSYSTEVRFEPLRSFGPATTVDTRRSVAGAAHDRESRRQAKTVMAYPEVILTGKQAASVGAGFASQTRKSQYQIFACSIMPDHVHLVIGRHHYPIEQVTRLLKQAGSIRLRDDGLHLFAKANGRLAASIWAQDFWKVFLFQPADIVRAIRYVEKKSAQSGIATSTLVIRDPV